MTTAPMHEPVAIRTRVQGLETRVLLHPGDSWRIGRSPRCNVPLKDPAVSQFAFSIQYPDPTETNRSHAQLRVLVLQRGPRVEIESLSGDRLVLSKGAPPQLLRPGERYKISLWVTGLAARVDLTTPAALGITEEDPSFETQTWTISGPRGNFPAWFDVAALACTIDRHPEIRPRLPNGQVASASTTLRMAVELFLGNSSRAFTQSRLVQALQAAERSVPGRQDKQARVVEIYRQQIAGEKLDRLAAMLRVGLCDMADFETEESNPGN